MIIVYLASDIILFLIFFFIFLNRNKINISFITYLLFISYCDNMKTSNFYDIFYFSFLDLAFLLWATRMDVCNFLLVICLALGKSLTFLSSAIPSVSQKSCEYHFPIDLCSWTPSLTVLFQKSSRTIIISLLCITMGFRSYLKHQGWTKSISCYGLQTV